MTERVTTERATTERATTERPATKPNPRRTTPDLDVLAMKRAPFDRGARIYRAVVLILFAIGLAAGFYFRA
jgi:uncharacterized protein HemX